MNLFAVYCRQLVEAEDASLYHFCSEHKLERTGIRRMLSGERMPKEELFQAFMNALTLTPTEEKKLLELYEQQKIGERRYQNRAFIKSMLSYIGELQSFQHRNQELIPDTKKIPDAPVVSVASHMEILFTIQQMMRMEEKALYSNLPVDAPDFLPLLQQEFYMRKNDTVFYHLLTVLKKSEMAFDVNYNLNLMKSVLPFAIQDDTRYQPVYCYGNSAGEISAGLYPYYLLSSDHLLLLASDFRSGVLYTQSVVLENYHRENRRLMDQTRPFIFKTKDSGRAMEYYLKDCVASSQPVYTLEFYPCIMKAYSKELFLPYLIIEEKDALPLVEAADWLGGFMQELEPYHAFLSREGLQRFIEDGSVGEQYAQILRPFSRETRAEILRSIEQLCREGRYHLHILPKKFLDPFPEIALELYEDRRIVLISANKGCAYSSMDENTLYEAFEDYFGSLLENPEITSVEETIQILQEMQEVLLA